MTQTVILAVWNFSAVLRRLLRAVLRARDLPPWASRARAAAIAARRFRRAGRRRLGPLLASRLALIAAALSFVLGDLSRGACRRRRHLPPAYPPKRGGGSVATARFRVARAPALRSATPCSRHARLPASRARAEPHRLPRRCAGSGCAGSGCAVSCTSVRAGHAGRVTGRAARRAVGRAAGCSGVCAGNAASVTSVG